MTICNHVNFFSKIINNKIICLDLGNKNIGVAISDQGLKFANPLNLIKRKNFKAVTLKIISIIKEENIGGIVLGWPINMDGSQGPRCDATRDFAHAFLRIFDIPICFHDERLSTIAADNILKNAEISKQKKKEKQDAIAASWILQSLLDVYNNDNLESLNG
jgi:putative Holliday junction resolvase|tara:strand:- start:64 stop:546 length:483 start_codon:yes stop_codon:yes gene_type:complete